jgi:hypothetical protein
MAVYPVAPGAPDYSSTSTNAYIPAIYSALLVKKFYPATVWSEISNTMYEGDIKSSGDTVNIRTRPTIETFSYRKGMVLPVQNPESAFVTLKIDQGEGFSFALDRVDEFQSDIKLMSAWAEDATNQMKQVIDRNLLRQVARGTINGASLVMGGSYTSLLGSTASFGTYATPGTDIYSATTATYATNLLDRILLYARILDENAVPDEDRFVVLPPAAIQILKQSDLKLAYLTGDSVSPLRNGKVGMIDRFKIFSSNNLDRKAANQAGILFGHKYATTFATQITESRIIENPFAFGKMMQGLQVYGLSCIKANMIGVDYQQVQA